MKTIVVTGATSGIGLSIVKKLILKSERVIALGRTEQSCQKARKEIDPDNKYLNLFYLSADFSSQLEIERVSDKIKSITNGRGIDVLINNASLISKWRLTSLSGYEMQFAVNHLAAFYLTHLLLEELRKTKGIIITTTSRNHRNTILDFDNLMLTYNYNMLRAYKRTKLCNVLFTYELNNRYIDITAYLIDPGLVKTDIGEKRSSGIHRLFWKERSKHGKSPNEIAKYYLDLIYGPVNKSKPYLYKYGKQIEPSRYSKRKDIQEKLWNLSLKMIGVV